MTKTRIEQFFSDHADALAAYNAKHAPEPDFTFESKVDPVNRYIAEALDALENDDADPAIEDGFDWLEEGVGYAYDDDEDYRPRGDFNNSDSDQISWSPGMPRP